MKHIFSVARQTWKDHKAGRTLRKKSEGPKPAKRKDSKELEDWKYAPRTWRTHGTPCNDACRTL
jgi:hypothetical protein